MYNYNEQEINYVFPSFRETFIVTAPFQLEINFTINEGRQDKLNRIYLQQNVIIIFKKKINGIDYSILSDQHLLQLSWSNFIKMN